MTPPTDNAKSGTFARVGLTPAECPLARARQRGWNDFLSSKPFRLSYDGWKRRKQFAYERGRIQAATALAFVLAMQGAPLTRWGDNETLFPAVLGRSFNWTISQAIHDETKVARKARRGKAKGKGAKP